MLLIKFIKHIIIKLFPNISYHYCYDYRESVGKASMGMCDDCMDSKCPHYVDTRS